MSEGTFYCQTWECMLVNILLCTGQVPTARITLLKTLVTTVFSNASGLEMGQWVKVLATKSEDLRFIFRPHMGEGKK